MKILSVDGLTPDQPKQFQAEYETDEEKVNLLQWWAALKDRINPDDHWIYVTLLFVMIQEQLREQTLAGVLEHMPSDRMFNA